VLHVVGARPNFMKVAPIMRAMGTTPDDFRQVLVHTGQHYDDNMSRVFFDELDLPRPDTNLEVGSGSHAQQTAEVMQRFEPLLAKYEPDWVIVVGDVNSTLACALVCAKSAVPVAHVEAGLRSFDRTMPEEINRILTDQVADLLFTPSPEAEAHLRREGVARERIHFVGNVMIDTLVHLLPRARARWPQIAGRWGLKRFALVTLHRPSNVDDAATLAELTESLNAVGHQLPVVFPVHPRTRTRLAGAGWTPRHCHLVEPLSYLDFLALEMHAALVITDSGGVQEETTYLGVPCLTLRPNTERPITLTEGTNRLVPPGPGALKAAVQEVLATARQPARPLAGWDGHAAERIVAVLRAL
jgi:UDP-N-acetylglucosamine 2-epimerase (non-hydrolysing)